MTTVCWWPDAMVSADHPLRIRSTKLTCQTHNNFHTPNSSIPSESKVLSIVNNMYFTCHLVYFVFIFFLIANLISHVHPVVLMPIFLELANIEYYHDILYKLSLRFPWMVPWMLLCFEFSLFSELSNNSDAPPWRLARSVAYNCF